MTIFSPIHIPYGDDSTWGRALDATQLKQRVQACREPVAKGRRKGITTREKGQRLEQLMVWLLPHIEGFRVTKTDIFATGRAQEVDIVIWNEKLPGGFPSFGEKVIVECKNWEQPVDSSDVAWFYWKMRFGGVRQGILVAAAGITGEGARRSHAQSIITLANMEEPSIRILVMTLSDIEQLTSREGLRNLIIDKDSAITAQAVFS